MSKSILLRPPSVGGADCGDGMVLSGYSRDRFLLKSMINHLHAFVKETSLTPDEWMKAIGFLTAVGHKTTGTRQEYITLSDVLGVSALVDTISFPPGHGGTESTILGPFHTEDAPDSEYHPTQDSSRRAVILKLPDSRVGRVDCL